MWGLWKQWHRPHARRRRKSVTLVSSRVEALEQRVLLSVSDLDTTFGTGGTQSIPFTATDVAVWGDNTSVVVGTTVVDDTSKFRIAKYTATGQLDTSFGTGGIAEVSSGNSQGAVSRVFITPDNKYLLVGK